ncbi:MAG: zinc ribbon domain-containing protein [Myxococcales bacterium]|nr:zinc ribbon domain-containing protein [Myxococcales bacterium]
MPVYEYGCNKCGHEFERFQKITDPEVKTCPECRSRQVERLISHSAFHLKGSGWYVTDYARKGAGDASTGGSEAKSGDSKSSESTTTKAAEPKAEGAAKKAKEKKKAAGTAAA